MDRYEPYWTSNRTIRKSGPKTLELLVGIHERPDASDPRDEVRFAMTHRYMAAFHGTKDMSEALSSSIPDRMEKRLQSRATDFDKDEQKEQKLYKHRFEAKYLPRVWEGLPKDWARIPQGSEKDSPHGLTRIL